MPFFHNNGADLYYECTGVGRPLLLLAGLASDVTSWGTIPAALAKDFTVIRLDNRGCGRTRCDLSFSIQDMAEDALALLNHLDCGPVSVIGHSMGGLIAQVMVATKPQCIDKAVLAGTFFELSRRNALLFQAWAETLRGGLDRAQWFKSLFTWIFTERFFESEDLFQASLEFALAYPYAQSPAQFDAQVRALTAWKPAGDIQTPCLLLAAENDLLVPPSIMLSMLPAMPNSQYQEIKDAAHSMHVEQAEAFVNAIRVWFSPDDAIAARLSRMRKS